MLETFSQQKCWSAYGRRVLQIKKNNIGYKKIGCGSKNLDHPQLRNAVITIG